MTDMTPLELAQKLIHCDTVSGGDEKAALDIVAELLADAGFTITYDQYCHDPRHCSLQARLKPNEDESAICLMGHIDTVAPGAGRWRHPPFAAAVEDDVLYGRGACDMKGGVAAMVCAACEMATAVQHGRGDIAVSIYGGHELGCKGSLHAVENPAHIANLGAVVVGTPTGCRPFAGHKGVMWIECLARGMGINAAVPERGDSALAKMLPFAYRLRDFSVKGEHIAMGKSSLVMTSFTSGRNNNTVPDRAVLTLDFRSLPEQNHTHVRRMLDELAGPYINLEVTLDLPPVWTDPSNPWLAKAIALMGPIMGERETPGLEAAGYGTDAAALRKRLPGIPVLLLGPGDPHVSHQDNERCPVEQLELAMRMYTTLIDDWTRNSSRGIAI